MTHFVVGGACTTKADVASIMRRAGNRRDELIFMVIFGGPWRVNRRLVVCYVVMECMTFICEYCNKWAYLYTVSAGRWKS